jgi:O-antigen ligase
MSALALPAGPTPRRPGIRFALSLALGALAFGAVAGYLLTTGSATRLVALTVVLVPVAIWKRPHLGPVFLLGAAIIIDQDGQTPAAIPLTQSTPYFTGIGPGHLEGADLLLLLVAFVYLVRGKEWGPRWRPRSHMSLAMGIVLGAVLLGVAVGQLHGGALRVSLMEARPYIYLAASYFLTAVMIRHRRAIRAMHWTIVLAGLFKAVQGIYVYFGHRHDYPRPESFIGHEASYFFLVYFMLTAALWLFSQRGTLRTVATWGLPLVFFCNLVNDRRAAWLMLAGALLTFVVTAYKAAPGRRRLLGRCLIGAVLVSVVYFPVFWNQDGSIAQPARAVRSQINPSARDASSDIYRVQENANLKLNIKQGGLLGKGFGVKIDYALPITDISSIDALIAYIPHNDVLDVIMRMGVLGGIGMWFLIGAGIIAGCRLARIRDRELAVVGAVTAASLVAYALMGAVDQGFFMFRIAFITGALLGMAEAARRLAAARPHPALTR